MRRSKDGLTRRDLGLALAAGTPAIALAAQQAPATPEDLDVAARQNLEKTRETLRNFQVPVATEPAFLFRP